MNSVFRFLKKASKNKITKAWVVDKATEHFPSE